MRWLSIPAAVVFLGMSGVGSLFSQAEENDSAAKKVDAFFAGAVVETTPEKLTVSRTVLGKTESRSFAVTPETKIEGRIIPKARVTVRYASDESGDTAVLVVVRGSTQQTAKKK